MGQTKAIYNWRVGDRLEAKDFMNVWYPSRIVAYDEKEDAILVHFEGWNQRFDEWFTSDSDKIRPLKGELKPPRENHKFFSTQFLKIGQYVLAPWKDGENYPGKIERINHKQKKYEVSFLDGATRNVSFRKVQVMTEEEVQELVSNLGMPDSMSTTTDTNSFNEVESSFGGMTDFPNLIRASSSHVKHHFDECVDEPQTKRTRLQKTSTCSYNSKLGPDVCHLCGEGGSLEECKDCDHLICQNCQQTLGFLNKDGVGFVCIHCLSEKSINESFSSPEHIKNIESLESLQKYLKNSGKRIELMRHASSECDSSQFTSDHEDLKKELMSIEDALNKIEEFVGGCV